MAEPAGAETAALVNVVYSASDPDVGDAVSVDLFWSLDASGNAGVRFAQGLPGGAGASASFDTTGLPPGTVHIFARARDTRGAESFAYAPGTVQIGGTGPTIVDFKLDKPDGVNDVQDGAAAITWTVQLPEGETGTISLFDDNDDRGEDGSPIAGGLSAGPDGARVFRWDLAGLEPGEHFVYGVLEHTGGRVASYAPASVQVSAAGCTCTEQGSSADGSLLALTTLAILATRFKKRCATGSSPTSTGT